MSEKINHKTEGDTYVIPEVNVTAIGNAEVKHSNQEDFKWNDLLLMGESNQKEATYVPPEDKSPEELRAILEQAKSKTVYKRIGLAALWHAA